MLEMNPMDQVSIFILEAIHTILNRSLDILLINKAIYDKLLKKASHISL